MRMQAFPIGSWCSRPNTIIGKVIDVNHIAGAEPRPSVYCLVMSTRMKDIARDLGVSVVTISKVLRNHPDVGDETRERVLARVKELDYRPNLAARSLVTGRTYLVGLVVPDLLHPFFAEIAKFYIRRLERKRLLSDRFVLRGRSGSRGTGDQSASCAAARCLDHCHLSTDRGPLLPNRNQKTPYVLIDKKFTWSFRELRRRGR